MIAMTLDDPHLTTRQCAEYSGYTTQYFRNAISKGLLQAEYARSKGARRGAHRIRYSDFVAFLKSIGFKRIPAAPR